MMGKALIGRLPRSVSIWLLYLVALMPAAWEFYLGATDNLGADPVKTYEQSLGLWSIRFLVLSLAISPMRDVLRLNLTRYRRALGLMCFYYALMHFAAYLVLDQEFAIHAVIEDVTKRPFIMLGMISLVLLVPLAMTSNALSIRVLGQRWLYLHRLSYLIAICGAIHLFLAAKILSIEQWLYLVLLALVLLYRISRRFSGRKSSVRILAARG
jgi:sulfoxide reductase heme-binding subunit YedZ